jgi:hypothetical protein
LVKAAQLVDGGGKRVNRLRELSDFGCWMPPLFYLNFLRVCGETDKSNVRKILMAYRRRLATVLVALYAFCVIAPHAALAFTHAQNAIYCFAQTETSPHQHMQSAKAHVHDDGTTHKHDQAANVGTTDDESSPQTACCGLFSVSAIAAEAPVALHFVVGGEKIAVLPPSDLADHPPGRLIRPPII